MIKQPFRALKFDKQNYKWKKFFIPLQSFLEQKVKKMGF